MTKDNTLILEEYISVESEVIARLHDIAVAYAIDIRDIATYAGNVKGLAEQLYKSLFGRFMAATGFMDVYDIKPDLDFVQHFTDPANMQMYISDVLETRSQK